ncbi:alpha/beta hydrolase [Caulobacter sp. RHG1]|uniref:alpha/beta hydrolase n=1 Tax=Caulobacter sp. (strain RHG1) TaxID=2545762 RepID=UPI001556A812|nr:prolyl oligopeptidase family serine peptidase [Caulobacter sp. RHG1]NQE61365.1 Xylanase [Caulobacter sp. RHG1]
MNRRALLAGGLGVSSLSAPALAKAALPETILLWPAGAPGGAGVTVQETVRVVDDQGHKGRDISGVREPRLSVHQPDRASDTAVLVIAGGAFNRVVFDKEGEEVCQWLAGAGYAAGALLYRLPGDGWAAGQDVMLHDAARALRILAARTGAKRIGVLGFSAGGTIAAALTSRADEIAYAPVDAADRAPLRIDFLGLGYPYLTVPASPRRALYSGPPKAPPPAFLFHAADDARVSVDNSLQAFQAWKAAGAEAALHVFEQGGHGFGLRAPTGSSAAAWPGLFLTWLASVKPAKT